MELLLAPTLAHERANGALSLLFLLRAVIHLLIDRYVLTWEMKDLR